MSDALKSWFAVVLIVFANLSSGGCIATETGNPSATLNPGMLDGQVLQDDPTLPSPPTISLRGGPGTVDPPDGEVLAWALENNLPPEAAAVESDGSFSLTLTARAGEFVRLQARSADGGYSVPLDFRVEADAGLSLSMEANPCLRLEPTNLVVAAVGSSSEVTIDIRNDCPGAVTRSRARLRIGAGGLELLDDGPLELAAGASGQVRVRIDAASPTLDDILLIPIASPRSELRAISFMAR